MVPAWAQTMNGHQGGTKAAPLMNGEPLTVTANDPKEVQNIRGLGFIGLLASGVNKRLMEAAAQISSSTYASVVSASITARISDRDCSPRAAARTA